MNSTTASNSKAGVEGIDGSSNGTKFNSGVYGSSAHGFGVNGTTNDGVGVLGMATATDAGIGVHGVSNLNIGSPYHVGGVGVQGDSEGTGVIGTSAGNAGSTVPYIDTIPVGVSGAGPHGVKGVVGGSSGRYPDLVAGVIGFSGYGVAGSTAALAGYARGSSDVFDGLATDPKGNLEYITVASIDYKGNEVLAGTLTTHGTPMIRTQSATGAVASYSARAASPTMEDFGKATLRQGVAYVALEPTFASTIDRSNYLVFVTPEGESRGLYTIQTPGGFQVRENGGGRASLMFDYRVVARPLDTKAVRFPAMSNTALRPAVLQRRLVKR